VRERARLFGLPDGLPRVGANPYPFEIVYGPPGNLPPLYDLSPQVRVVAMSKPMPPERELITFPSYNGYSIGRFEGDTLVIESAAFKGDVTFADATGAPQSDGMKTVERIRKISPTELEVLVTVHDPEYYTRDCQAPF